MRVEKIFIAEDGKRFSDEESCLAYEEKQRQLAYEEKQRQERILKIQNAAIKLDEALWNKYYPDWDETADKPDLSLAFVWLRTDLISITLHSETKPSLDELKAEIEATVYGKEISSRIRWKEMEREVNIRSDWPSALKSVKEGDDLSDDVGYSFYHQDITELAMLHKKNRFRKKIEDLLTNCNYHSECGDFCSGDYKKYIA